MRRTVCLLGAGVLDRFLVSKLDPYTTHGSPLWAGWEVRSDHHAFFLLVIASRSWRWSKKYTLFFFESSVRVDPVCN